MADTKVSGLAAVAAALTTHEIPVNEAGTSKKLTVAQLMALLPQGTLGYVQVTANQAGISATTDLTSLTLTVTPVSSTRRIRITGYGRLNQNTGAAQIVLAIQEGATVINLMSVQAAIGTALGYVTAILVPTAGAHTYKLTLATGANTVDLLAGATNPAYLVIEDIGI